MFSACHEHKNYLETSSLSPQHQGHPHNDYLDKEFTIADIHYSNIARWTPSHHTGAVIFLELGHLLLRFVQRPLGLTQQK
jgi:hypothetical protein